MTLLPESIRHYLPAIIAAQIVLFAAAILVGGFLLIRRLARRPPIEGQILEEKEKLAGEIHAEILRLRELRDRLFDGFGENAEPTFKGKTVQQSAVPAPVAAPAVEAPAIEVQKSNQEFLVTIEMQKQEIEALKAKLAALSATPAIPAATTDAAASAPLTEEARKNIETEVATRIRGEMNEKINSQETTIKDLSSRLEEYEIFEEELAQIKKYKIENDQLKQQVSTGTSALPDGFSENDIAQLFSEMSLTNAEGALATVPVGTPPEGSAGPSAEALAAAFPTDDKTVISQDAKTESKAEAANTAQEASLEDELEKLLAGGGAEAASESPKAQPPKGFVEKKVSEEPDVMQVDSENAEAMAMLGGDQDELMKEFEKVLAPTATKDKQE